MRVAWSVLALAACGAKSVPEPPGIEDASAIVFVVGSGDARVLEARRPGTPVSLLAGASSDDPIYAGLYPVPLERLHLAEGAVAPSPTGRPLRAPAALYALDVDEGAWVALEAWPAELAGLTWAEAPGAAPDETVGLAVGWTSSCAVRGDGTARCWGNASGGRIAIRDEEAIERPRETLIAGVEELSLGDTFGCALGRDGRVRCWGVATTGALGREAASSTAEPLPVDGVADAVMIRAGPDYACALSAAGRVLCWGRNGVGQVGVAGIEELGVPVDLGLPPMAELAVSTEHACARTPRGEVWCWGNNVAGELPGDRGARAPARVELRRPATALALGAGHTCARLDDGSLECLGPRDFGELATYEGALLSGGDALCVHLVDDTLRCVGSSTRDALQPEPLMGLCRVRTVALYGARHACALDLQRKVSCWGWGGYGQLGALSGLSRPMPAKVEGLSGAARLLLSRDLSCVDTSTAMSCAGAGARALGASADSSRPVVVPRVRGYVLRDRFACILDLAGVVRCSGDNADGVLARPPGELPRSDVLVEIAGLGPVRELAGGRATVYALLESGELFAWGSNSDAQLGVGVGPDHVTTPVRVLEGVRRVVAADLFACALDGAGALWCWGGNLNGVLGLGQSSGQATPKRVGLPARVVSVSAADRHVAVALEDGAAYCWGENLRGECGTGGSATSGSPMRMLGVTDAVEVSTTDRGTCVRDARGGVRCAGNNGLGQLGTGVSGGPSLEAREVLGVRGATAIAGGLEHRCAIVERGEVMCWGSDRAGQLMQGTQVESATPLLVTE